MVQTVIRSKKILILVGAALVLLLAVACAADGDGSDGPGTTGGVSAADLSNLLAAAGGPQAVAGLFQSGSSANTGIWVNGAGKASGEPDLGIISLGVEALADTASEARRQAAEAIEKTISVLKSHDIENRDMQTSRFSIAPRYTTHEVTKCVDLEGVIPRATPPATPPPTATPVPPPGAASGGAEMILEPESKGRECRVEFERILTGYQVTNTLTVKVRDLDSMGGIIDGVTEAAGNLVRINHVSFTIEDTKPLQAQAREEAIAHLLDKANAMARLAGVELGKLVFLTETSGGVPKSFARLEAAPAFGFSMDHSTSILAGELDVNVSVQGVFSIAP
ncbi:MAG: SIMPL domain-containing protein [Chloroflexi bacterium]|nr:SIMPL domain-containing protein [Chloroflexota bacterium]